jgi:hypothetical protein
MYVLGLGLCSTVKSESHEPPLIAIYVEHKVFRQQLFLIVTSQ